MSGIPNRPEKITFGEMRDSGVRGVLIYCSDFRLPLDRDERRLVAGHIRLSDLEPRFV